MIVIDGFQISFRLAVILRVILCAAGSRNSFYGLVAGMGTIRACLFVCEIVCPIKAAIDGSTSVRSHDYGLRHLTSGAVADVW